MRGSRQATVVKTAFQNAGIQFTEHESGGIGVRLLESPEVSAKAARWRPPSISTTRTEAAPACGFASPSDQDHADDVLCSNTGSLLFRAQSHLYCPCVD